MRIKLKLRDLELDLSISNTLTVNKQETVLTKINE